MLLTIGTCGTMDRDYTTSQSQYPHTIQNYSKLFYAQRTIKMQTDSHGKI